MSAASKPQVYMLQVGGLVWLRVMLQVVRQGAR